MQVIGRRLDEVDPWACEHFMCQLRACVAYPELSGEPDADVAQRLLDSLPSAIIAYKCTCSDPGCHIYRFSGYLDESKEEAEYRCLHFATGYWDSFSIEYRSDGTLLGIEILVDTEIHLLEEVWAEADHDSPRASTVDPKRRVDPKRHSDSFSLN